MFSAISKRKKLFLKIPKSVSLKLSAISLSNVLDIYMISVSDFQDEDITYINFL